MHSTEEDSQTELAIEPDASMLELETEPLALPWRGIATASPLKVSEWAERYRVLDRFTSALPGPWRTEQTPYLREPMDSFTDPTVEEIDVQSCTQVGKTEFILNCLGYVIDFDPAPTMIVLPRHEDAKGWADKRVKPMVLASPRLRKQTTGVEDDLAGKTYRFRRMLVKFAGSNSPADLASDPCRNVFFDEVNKYPRFSGREANPLKLGGERTRTFWNRKQVKVSTPTLTTGYITVELRRSDHRRYWLPCPRCGRYQPLVFSKARASDLAGHPGLGQVRWPEGATAEQIREESLAWYECGLCHGRIEERDKVAMLPSGVWCPAGANVDDRGRVRGAPPPMHRRGYQLSALFSPWVPWSVVAAEFLDCKGDTSELMSFVNSVLGEPWEEKAQDTTTDVLKKRAGVWALGEVPPEAAVLTAGIDVQKDHYWYAIRAWGVNEESWLVRYGRVELERELERVILDTHYPVAGTDQALPVRLALMDSGYRTNEVYSFCRKYRDRLRPTKGYERVQAAPYRSTIIDKDRYGKPVPNGFALWTLDVTYYKDKLHRLVHTPPESPGQWHLYQDIDEIYLEQLAAEHKAIERDKKTGRASESWQLKREGLANHLLDCEVLTLAGAEMLKVYLLREPGVGVTVYRPRRRVISPGVQRD